MLLASTIQYVYIVLYDFHYNMLHCTLHILNVFRKRVIYFEGKLTKTYILKQNLKSNIFFIVSKKSHSIY